MPLCYIIVIMFHVEQLYFMACDNGMLVTVAHQKCNKCDTSNERMNILSYVKYRGKTGYVLSSKMIRILDSINLITLIYYKQKH